MRIAQGPDATVRREPRRPAGESFYLRRGTGRTPYAERLARARLLFLRKREVAADWLALGVLIALGWMGPTHGPDGGPGANAAVFATAGESWRADSILAADRAGTRR